MNTFNHKCEQCGDIYADASMGGERTRRFCSPECRWIKLRAEDRARATLRYRVDPNYREQIKKYQKRWVRTARGRATQRAAGKRHRQRRADEARLHRVITAHEITIVCVEDQE